MTNRRDCTPAKAGVQSGLPPSREHILAIRDATATDLLTIVALLADDEKGAAREDASAPLDPGYHAAFAVIDADPNQRLIVAERHSTVVGTMQLTFLPGLSYRGAWRLQVEAVRVASHLRNQGIGEQMIRWAIERARERGCNHVQLTSHRDRAAAHRFYDRLGFAQSHVGFKLTP